jgi:putative thioredoxin
MSELPNVVEVSESNFPEQVIAASEQVPVLVDFWADWCAPCKMLLPVLLKLAQEYGDKLRIAKINTDVERELAAEHGIRSLPTLRLYRHGQVVEQVLGAQPEAALRTLIDAYIERESDRLLAEALTLAQSGDRDRALELMTQAYRDDPDNPRLPLEYARLCLEANQVDRAEEVLQALPRELREQPQARNLQALVELTRSISGAPPLEELEAALEADPKQPQLRFQLAARQTLAADYDRALENFLELMKQDRDYGEGAAQRGLLAIFALLGDEDERVTRYRRQIFALLH